MREGQPTQVADMLAQALRDRAAHAQALRDRRRFIARLQLEQIHALGQAFARGAASVDPVAPVAHTSNAHDDMFGLDELGRPR